MLGSTVDTFLRIYVRVLWTIFTHFLREGGTPILKSILRPALPFCSGKVCTVDASVADVQFYMEIRTIFP